MKNIPTDIEYKEGLIPPYRSFRNIEVYGEDKNKRLKELPRDIMAFEDALTSMVNQIKNGNYVTIND